MIGGSLRKIWSSLTIGGMLFFLFSTMFAGDVKIARAVDANNLIPDAEFTSWQTLDADGVQQFLNTRGGTRLRTYREGGLSAAQIIANAARANGINPFVILSTIQKEESIVDSNYNFDYRIVWAMGYGVCDSCSLSDPNVVKYRGFTNQITNGAWQLKRNYSYWAVNGSAWNVGRTMIIDGQAVRFATRATSSLYRYTPHLPGNENFVNIYNRYKTFRPTATYSSRISTPARSFTLRPGQTRTIYATIKNTGSATWYRDGANPLHLGNSSPQDRGSVLTAGQNIRWNLRSVSVRPGRTGVFALQVTAPTQAGTYVEKYRPLAEYLTWFGDEMTLTFIVR